MSHAAALLVPFALPGWGVEGGDAGVSPAGVAPPRRARDADDPWDAAGGDARRLADYAACSAVPSSVPTAVSAPWYHALVDVGARNGHDGARAGEVRVALGYGDGSVAVYARPVRLRRGADAGGATTPGSPISPISAALGAGEGARRGHRRSARVSWHATTGEDAVVSASSASAQSSAASTGRSDDASPVDGHWDGSDSGATVRTFAENVSPWQHHERPAPLHAERLLETQFHAQTRGRVIAHSDTQAEEAPPPSPHAARRPERPARPTLAPPPAAAHRRAPAGGGAAASEEEQPLPPPSYELEDTPLGLVRRLLSPDGTRVEAVRLFGEEQQLAVQQASGRVTTWSLAHLTMASTALVRASQTLAPKRQGDVTVTLDAAHHVGGAEADAAPFAHHVRVPHAAPTPVPPSVRVDPVPVCAAADVEAPAALASAFLLVHFPLWHDVALLLRPDVVLRTLVPCAALQLPAGRGAAAGAALHVRHGGRHVEAHVLAAGGAGGARCALVRAIYRLDAEALARGGAAAQAPRESPPGAPRSHAAPPRLARALTRRLGGAAHVEASAPIPAHGGGTSLAPAACTELGDVAALLRAVHVAGLEADAAVAERVAHAEGVEVVQVLQEMQVALVLGSVPHAEQAAAGFVLLLRAGAAGGGAARGSADAAAYALPSAPRDALLCAAPNDGTHVVLQCAEHTLVVQLSAGAGAVPGVGPGAGPGAVPSAELVEAAGADAVPLVLPDGRCALGGAPAPAAATEALSERPASTEPPSGPASTQPPTEGHASTQSPCQAGAAPQPHCAAPRAPAPPAAPASAVAPLNMQRVVLASDTGLCAAPLDGLLSGAALPAAVAGSRPTWDAAVTLLQLVGNPRTGTRHLLGGSERGDLAVWDAGTLQLEAEWCWFAAPVQTVVPFGGVPHTSRLFGCVLCVVADGAAALLSLDDVRLVQLFPGSDTPLVHAAVHDGEELLLQYASGRARIWSLRTLELVRSVTAEQTLAHLGAAPGAWQSYEVPGAPRCSVPHATPAGMLAGTGAAPPGGTGVLAADMRRALDTAARTLRGALGLPTLVPLCEACARRVGAARTLPGEDAAAAEFARLVPDSGDALDRLLATLRTLMRVVLPWGVDPALDAQCAALLGPDATPPAPPACAALTPPGYVSVGRGAALGTSPDVCAQRLLATTCIALLAGAVKPLHAAAIDVLAAVCDPARLQRAARGRFASPSLAVLVRHVLDENEVLRCAAHMLFAQYVRAAPEAELDALIAAYAPWLPSRRAPPGGGRRGEHSGGHGDRGGHAEPHGAGSGAASAAAEADSASSQALLLLGLVASERYAYLAPALLRDMAVSIAQGLSAPGARAFVALELCCTGFGIWQHYVDAVALVRGIFARATEPDAPAGEAGAAHSGAVGSARLVGLTLRGLARRATLEIAHAHAALFMSTLAMDIVHAPSVEQSQVTIRLVAFVIHQRPLVLYPSLPRLVEAVVKSLDPTMGSMRSAVAHAATVMIKELVHTYPSMAFHERSQRLAVGTHEGPAVLYDLHTATRLYVLEGHTHPVTACSFSPDGRRFLSMSLEEQCVLIWRLSTGVFDMFVPSAVSRLASSNNSAAAYRTIRFHLGDAARLSPAESLTSVAFEWPNDQSVHLRVGEASVNLGVV